MCRQHGDGFVVGVHLLEGLDRNGFLAFGGEVAWGGGMRAPADLLQGRYSEGIGEEWSCEVVERIDSSDRSHDLVMHPPGLVVQGGKDRCVTNIDCGLPSDMSQRWSGGGERSCFITLVVLNSLCVNLRKGQSES